MIRILSLIFLLWCGAANAQLSGGLMFPGPGTAHSTGGGSYTGPGDVVSGATEFWGLRAYNATYATGSNPAAVVCDSATFATCSTINILSSGDFDTATASGSAACATSCVVKTLKGQIGGNDATCSSASTCATLTFNCLGTKPCLTFNSANSQTYSFGPIGSAATGGATITAVLGRTGSSIGSILGGFGSLFLGSNGADTGITQWASGTVSATQTDNAVHAVQAVNNGASPASYMNVDGTTTTGSSTFGGVNLNAIGSAGGSVYYNGKLAEIGLYLGTNFTGTQANNVCHNQKYWLPSLSC